MGSFCVSIDLELAWGVWDKLTPDRLQLASEAETAIVGRLLALSEKHDLPVTWATVGRIFDAGAEASLPAGPRGAWYAPQLVDAIRRSKVPHDLGSHSYAHVYYDRISRDEAAEDLGRDVAVRKAWGLPLRTWVYPRNGIGHVDLLAAAGVEVYRTHDAGLLQRIRDAAPRWYGAGNLLDKALPVVPPLVHATDVGGIVALPSSTLLIGRNGPRRIVRPAVTRFRWKRALDAAAGSDGCFHAWFHPSNFYHRAESQYAVVDAAFAHASKLRDAGRLQIRTMADFA